MDRTLVRYGKIPPGATQVVKSKYIESNTLIIHTVSNDTTLYLTEVSVGMNTDVAEKHGKLFVRNVADEEQYRIFALKFDQPGTYANSLHFDPPLEIPEKYDICVYSVGASLTVYGFIKGWEE